MPWPYPFGETVQILDGSAASHVRYGQSGASYPVKATYTNCAVAPADANGTGGNEFTDARDTVFIGLTVFLPDGAVVAATDRVRARGIDWDVIGEPQQWQSPFTGARPGMAVSLRRVTG